MSASSKQPGVMVGWSTPGPKGTRRLQKAAKRTNRRLRRRQGKRMLVAE